MKQIPKSSEFAAILYDEEEDYGERENMTEEFKYEPEENMTRGNNIRESLNLAYYNILCQIAPAVITFFSFISIIVQNYTIKKLVIRLSKEKFCSNLPPPTPPPPPPPPPHPLE